MRALILLCGLLSSCTVLYVSGSGNTICDSNTHGDFGITRTPAQPLLDRLRGHATH
ncbi:hypothetical protein R8871_02564 [Paraburkholderia graminis C4D1M]|uniref:Lipoprotein n=1 Tax=Paraburkholderia graminis (strain ATCC 700544 / DSM 17151 / LMG 18924 / NCIMB 13744 / C4D1M) TaxID=396598 RepID=B1G971_PARG4|nr:hypothetical protein [Paraburkholderia graminis]EDT07332.1 hypothetical protein BgramDRAFT_5908 [Paraburkholderia graminis C4D1M]CAB3682012.1 hypothetical protein R8871_02564 [Paraburkholderia graminis C4D1M]